MLQKERIRVVYMGVLLDEWESFIDLKIEMIGLIMTYELPNLHSDTLIEYYDRCEELIEFYGKYQFNELPVEMINRLHTVNDYKCRIKQTLSVRPDYWNYFTSEGRIKDNEKL